MTATTTKAIWERMRRATESGRVTGRGESSAHGGLVVLGGDVMSPSVEWVPLDVVLPCACVVVLVKSDADVVLVVVVLVVDVVVLVVVVLEASEKPPNIFIPAVLVVLQLQSKPPSSTRGTTGLHVL